MAEHHWGKPRKRTWFGYVWAAHKPTSQFSGWLSQMLQARHLCVHVAPSEESAALKDQIWSLWLVVQSFLYTMEPKLHAWILRKAGGLWTVRERVATWGSWSFTHKHFRLDIAWSYCRTLLASSFKGVCARTGDHNLCFQVLTRHYMSTTLFFSSEHSNLSKAEHGGRWKWLAASSPAWQPQPTRPQENRCGVE